MSHLESIASSAVRAAIKVKASVIICFMSSGRAARLIAKYRPTMPVLSVVIPRLKTNQLRWTFTGAFEVNSYDGVVFGGFYEKARQSLIIRGPFPMLADPQHPLELPEWTDIVKTGTFKELAPYDPDWYYIRAASIAKKIYLRGGLGVGAFQRIYGGHKRNGSRPPHFGKSSGGIARIEFTGHLISVLSSWANFSSSILVDLEEEYRLTSNMA